MKITLMFVLALVSVSAHADFNLAYNGKKVTCFAEDNVMFELNAKRTSVRYSTEGESLGPQKITKKKTDGDTYVSYTTKEGTLLLSDRGDAFAFPGESFSRIRCK